MRISCEVEVIYTLSLSGGGAPCKSSRCRASVSLGKKPHLDPSSSDKKKKDEVYFVVSTSKNVEGTKYKVKGNIVKIFSKFVQEGKATIKFRDPAHDIAISKAEPSKLIELINVLRLSPQEQCASTIKPLGLLQPSKKQHLDKPKTKLVIKSRGEYPIKGFPESLEIIQATGISLNRIDRRILQLKNIRNIDLSSNSIKEIPECIKDVRLVELKLSGNKIFDFPDVLCYGEITKSLKVLDMSRNELTFLPNDFSSFKVLVQLKLDCNALQALPRRFGKMASLKYFSASNNKLGVLPPTFPKLTLESLDLYGNPFSATGLMRTCKDLGLPTLKELAGRAVKIHRIPYCPRTLPVVLCHFLDCAKKCLCGKPCMDSYLHYVVTLGLHKVSATVTAVDQKGTVGVPVEAFLCSAKCHKLWKL